MLKSITINGSPISSLDSFAISVTIQNGFKTGEANTFDFEYEKMYWIDSRVQFAGYGTEEAPYLITNGETLAHLAYVINNGILDQSLNRIYYKVTNDIDLTEKFWIPIGTEQNPFDGTIYLGNCQIKGVAFAETYPHLSWSEYCYGVFGYVTDNAKIILEESIIPSIILFVVIALFLTTTVAIIAIILNMRKKKIKRLSESLSLANISAKADKTSQAQQQENAKNDMDEQVQEILKQAEEKQKNNKQK